MALGFWLFAFCLSDFNGATLTPLRCHENPRAAERSPSPPFEGGEGWGEEGLRLEVAVSTEILISMTSGKNTKCRRASPCRSESAGKPDALQTLARICATASFVAKR